MVGAHTIDFVCVTAESPYPEESFEWIKFLCNKDSGLKLWRTGVVPGARPDVWEAPEPSEDPNHVVFADALAQGMPEFQMPANGRNAEYINTMWQGLDPLWVGDETDAEEVVTKLVPALQAVLDSPMA
jgi:hypothetical protein